MRRTWQNVNHRRDRAGNAGSAECHVAVIGCTADRRDAIHQHRLDAALIAGVGSIQRPGCAEYAFSISHTRSQDHQRPPNSQADDWRERTRPDETSVDITPLAAPSSPAIPSGEPIA